MGKTETVFENADLLWKWRSCDGENNRLETNKTNQYRKRENQRGVIDMGLDPRRPIHRRECRARDERMKGDEGKRNCDPSKQRRRVHMKEHTAL